MWRDPRRTSESVSQRRLSGGKGDSSPRIAVWFDRAGESSWDAEAPAFLRPMTAKKRFKRRVRDRAAKTGESYTAALAHVRRRPEQEHPMLYDTIGATYTTTRQTEPRIAAQLWAALGDARTVLNVGAGTGSYEPPDREVTAVEPSAVMRAQRPAGAARTPRPAERLDVTRRGRRGSGHPPALSRRHGRLPGLFRRAGESN